MFEVQFVAIRLGPGGESRRTLELRISMARGHASRVAHRHRAVQRRRKDILRTEAQDWDNSKLGWQNPEPANSIANLMLSGQVIAVSRIDLKAAPGLGR